MSSYLLALDIGTSACKGAIFDLKGQAVASADEAYPTFYPHPGWAEQQPEDWWAAACRVIRRLLEESKIRPTEIAGIGVDGQSWAMVALDKDGRVLLPSPLWTDTRAIAACDRLRETVGEAALHQVCGNPLMPGYTTPQVLWYKEHCPDLYARTRVILQSNGFIVERLTGKLSQNVSQGYGWYCFRSDELTWDEDFAQATGVDTALLPPLYACHDIVGSVTEDAAEATGLTPGIPVVAGGLDAAAGTLGVGITEDGETQEQGGQAGGMSICLDRYVSHPRLILSAHVVPERWLLQGGTTGGGGALKWLRDQCCPELSFREMSELAAQTPPMSDGLIFLPYMARMESNIAQKLIQLSEPPVVNPFWDVSLYERELGLVLSASQREAVTQALEAIYPKEAGDFTQALMELGATICGPNRAPDCHSCPCAEICLAYRHGTQEQLPVKAPKKEKRQEDRTVFILRCDGRYALEKRPSKGLLAGLWQFPNVTGSLTTDKALEAAEKLGLQPSEILREVERKHIFTHIQWNMKGIYLEVKEPAGNFRWFTADQINTQAALPTAFRQFWDLEEKEHV